MIAKIGKKIRLAEDTLLIEFKLPGKVSYVPGQSFEVKLLNPPYRDREGTSRFFSIANDSGLRDYVTTITRIRKSAFKRSLKKMPVGSPVEVGSIGGTFLLPREKKQSLVFIAGGVGITPFHSMIEYSLRQRGWQVQLLYSNRNRRRTVHFEELRELGGKKRNFEVVFTMTDDREWKGESSRINSRFIKRYVKTPKSKLYYLAGSPRMNYDITEALHTLGVPAKNIKTEDFTGY